MCKMHSCFNDFVIIDMRSNEYKLEEIQKIVPKLAARENGIGCDQVLIIAHSKRAYCKMLIYNSDGSTSNMCANGLRCVGRLLAEENGRDVNEIEISGTNYKTKRKNEITIAVNIGRPKISWNEIPLNHKMETPILKYRCDRFVDPIVLNVGNPHAIFLIEQDIMLEKIDLSKWGTRIENDPLFPERTNVSFVKILDKNNVQARVWERGAGETKSCGSAASAIAWASIYSNKTFSPVNIHFGPDRKIVVELLKDGTLESSAEAHIIIKNKIFEIEQ